MGEEIKHISLFIGAITYTLCLCYAYSLENYLACSGFICALILIIWIALDDS